MLIYGDTVDVNAANWLRLRAGNTNGIAINSPTTFSNQLHSLGTVNAGTATASTGDSIQVTVTGITSSAIIVACYAKNSPTALTDIPPAVGNVQTNKFTIFATSGKNVNYFIGHK